VKLDQTTSKLLKTLYSGYLESNHTHYILTQIKHVLYGYLESNHTHYIGLVYTKQVWFASTIEACYATIEIDLGNIIKYYLGYLSVNQVIFKIFSSDFFFMF